MSQAFCRLKVHSQCNYPCDAIPRLASQHKGGIFEIIYIIILKSCEEHIDNHHTDTKKAELLCRRYLKRNMHLLMVLHEKMQQQVLESKFYHQLQSPVNPNPGLHQMRILSLRTRSLPEQLRIGIKFSVGQKNILEKWLIIVLPSHMTGIQRHIL